MKVNDEKRNHTTADFLLTISIKAKDFAAEMTSMNVQTKDLQSETMIAKEHIDNNAAVRKMLIERDQWNRPPDHSTDLGATWTWAFAANQWNYVGNDAANTSMKADGTGTVTANGTVDLFGWVGASSSWTSAAKWGISASTTSADYGNVADEALKSDWGNVPGIGTGWRTLTGGDTDREWNYLFNTRSASTVNGVNDARYAKAIVNGVNGIVLFPDSYTHPTGVTAPNSINSSNISFANAHNTWSGDDWTKMETAGCVFLPAGGNRSGTTMSNVGTGGYYWTSTPTGSYVYKVFYTMSTVNTSTSTGYRYSGYSVRLVHDAN